MESFLIQDLKLFTPVRIGNQAAYAHLDTGASGNMIVVSAAEGLESIEDRHLQGAIGQQQVRQVRIPRMEFLGEKFEQETAVIFDGAGYFGDVPFPVSMTLGAATLLARPLILDFKRLWLGFAETSIRDDLARYAMDCTVGLPLITLRMGSREYRAIFDTGAAYTLMNSAHAEEIGLSIEQVYTIEGRDPAGGTSLIPVCRLENLSVGDVALGPTEIVQVNLGSIEERLQSRIDFVLGANTMLTSNLVWVLDKESGSMVVSERSVDVCV